MAGTPCRCRSGFHRVRDGSGRRGDLSPSFLCPVLPRKLTLVRDERSWKDSTPVSSSVLRDSSLYLFCSVTRFALSHLLSTPLSYFRPAPCWSAPQRYALVHGAFGLCFHISEQDRDGAGGSACAREATPADRPPCGLRSLTESTPTADLASRFICGRFVSSEHSPVTSWLVAGSPTPGARRGRRCARWPF